MSPGDAGRRAAPTRHIHMNMNTDVRSNSPDGGALRQHHDSLTRISDSAGRPLEKSTGDPGEGRRVQLVVGEGSPRDIPSQAELSEGSLQSRGAGLLAGDSEKVLCAARIPFLDPVSSTPQGTGEPHPPLGKHSHGAEGEREESDPQTAQFSVALSKMGPGAVVDSGPSPRERKGRVDQDQGGPHLRNRRQDVLVGV